MQFLKKLLTGIVVCWAFVTAVMIALPTHTNVVYTKLAASIEVGCNDDFGAQLDREAWESCVDQVLGTALEPAGEFMIFWLAVLAGLRILVAVAQYLSGRVTYIRERLPYRRRGLKA